MNVKCLLINLEYFKSVLYCSNFNFTYISFSIKANISTEATTQ